MPYEGHYSQIGQDIFVLTCLKGKRDGIFLEIGSHDPIYINNTYLLEKEYGWKGILVEYDPSFGPAYAHHRPASHAILQDATTVNYKQTLDSLQFPSVLDYLQIDLEVENGSTLQTLELLDKTVMDTYTFRIITFEHDIRVGNFHSTRNKSRHLLSQRGYVRLFSDIDGEGNHEDGSLLVEEKQKKRQFNTEAKASGKHMFCFEDWWVHPDHVDMNHIHKVLEGFDSKTIYNYKDILRVLIQHMP